MTNEALLMRMKAAQARGGRPTLEGGTIPRGPVGSSRDLNRIAAVPSWVPDRLELEDLKATLQLTGGMELRDIQARALLSAQYAGGLFAPIGVGQGKTLIAALLPTVLDRRAVVLTTPSLVKQAVSMVKEYSRHFLIRRDVKWVGYSTLSTASGQRILEDLDPDLIICDEAHNLKDRSSARTKRFLRFMKHKPGTILCALSGTITKRSVMDFAHLLELALGDASTLPHHWPTLKEWSEVLDVPKTGAPRHPGHLRAVFGADVRDGWRRKFISTCGVVASEADDVGSTLIIRRRPLPEHPIVLQQTKRLHERWERPDGEPLTTAMEVAAVERQIRLGGHYRWDWPLGVSVAEQLRWHDTRKYWLRALKLLMDMDGNKPGRDSPMLMERCVARGEYEDAFHFWEQWQLAKREIVGPKSVWSTLTLDPLEDIVAMVREPECIWTDIVAVGHKLAQLGGWRYYGAGDDTIIHEDGSKPIVASIQAHGTGRNLQMFSRALVAGGGPTGLVWQQMLGRHHRQGQTADEVRFDVLFPEELKAARADAKFIQEITGETQKLMLANMEDFDDE